MDVVETVTADTMAELRGARDAATRADLVELRLDGVRDLDVAGVLQGRRQPAIVTCRPTREGGRFTGSEGERLTVLRDAAKLGAEYVDVEWQSDWSRVARGPATRLVLSHHDMVGVPADLADRVRAMHATGADVVKVAVTAGRLSDCLTLKRAVEGVPSRVAIAMGAAGRVTRVHPSWMGSRWMYGGQAAPGQLTTAELIETYRVRETSASTDVFAIVGAPLGHSASPAMHNAAFRTAGIDAIYVPLETGDAAECLEVADALGLRGASVTAPLKTSLVEHVTPGDDVSREIGAVNTLRRGARGWEGRNFDVDGFLAPFDTRSIDLTGCRAVVLGAGGAARAAAWGLAHRGARVEIAARRTDRARALASALGAAVTSWPPPAGWDVLVNATPIGTWPHAGEAPIDCVDRALVGGRIVYDLVYNPAETQLLAWARAAGATTIGGLEMLACQAARQFQWWTGRTVEPRIFEDAAAAFIAGSSAPRSA